MKPRLMVKTHNTKFMKNASLFCAAGQRAAQGLLLALVWLAVASAGAQNFVRNPDWAQPLGPDNWTVKFVGASSAADFWIQGRTTLAHRDKVYGTWDGASNFDPFFPTGPCYFGGHFRPYTGGLCHAYFDQVVTGLTPGASYVVSAWMAQFQSDYLSKAQVYLSTLGGASGTVSNGTAYATGYVYNNDGWAKYSVTSTASASGQIEVQLHYNKIGYTSGNVWLNMDGFYDHISLMPQVATPLPAPRILSLTVSNQTAAFKWSTIMNNTYDIQVSANLASWSSFKTNLFATGTNLTYTGALTGAPGVPQFFRIASYSWVP
jgi:hypothetical protein